jgi:hypothetical protein
MSGAVPPFPKYVFMAWCSGQRKHRKNCALILLHNFILLSLSLCCTLPFSKGFLTAILYACLVFTVRHDGRLHCHVSSKWSDKFVTYTDHLLHLIWVQIFIGR